MNSFWTNTVNPPKFRELNKDIKTDVLIIGGGIAGILCAYMLQRMGVNYVLLEADKICGGITQNTTAKITVQHGLMYDKLIRRFGIEKARMYFDAHAKALANYRELAKSVDCDFVSADSYVYSKTERAKVENEVNALSKIGYRADLVERTELLFSICGAVRMKDQAHFNPLKFLYSIAQGLHICEGTKVTELRGKTAVTPKGKVRAEKIITATHFPFINKHGLYFMKLYQHRSYVMALSGAQKLNGMYVDESDKGMSFRSCDGLLLIGGGGHRTGKKGGKWRELSDFAGRYYPNSREVTRWATQDCMTLDSVPYIGRYSSGTSDLYVATGFNKWGMTSSMVAAEILADMVMGRENPYAPVFDPSRTILRPQLLTNFAESVLNIITPRTPRCPHLGCALKYNPDEHSWDCPCHGSRFTDSGELINNPATDDIRR